MEAARGMLLSCKLPSTPGTGIQHAKLIIIIFEIMGQYDVKMTMRFCFFAVVGIGYTLAPSKYRLC
jgi:hypothetical protein